MLNKVWEFINENNLIEHNGQVIVGLSGGADSICLTDVLRRKNVRVIAAHVNHMIREDAGQDEDFVREFCSRYDIALQVKRVDVPAIARRRKLSLEMAGRDERYKFFAQLAKEHNATAATAHNLNDSAESFVMHLMRGAGGEGLCGIREKISIHGVSIVRPLLCCSRAEIESYVAQRGLPFLTDISNFDRQYTRNYIRHSVIPTLCKDGGLAAIERAMEIIRCDQDYLKGVTNKLINEHVTRENGSVTLDVKWFNTLDVAIKRRIIKEVTSCFKKGTVQFVHIEAVIDICNKNYGGKLIQLPGGVTAALQKGKLIVKGDFTNG